MTIVDRVKNICLTPTTEWGVVAGEAATPSALISGYAAPLAALSAVAGFIGGSLVGFTVPFLGGTYRAPVISGLVGACVTFVLALVGVFVLSLIIDALAPSFGGQKNSSQAMKVAVYSYTPAWVAGVLRIVPALGLLAVIGALWGIYLLYLGLPRLMKSPQDKALGYTVVVIVAAIVITVVIGAFAALFGGVGMYQSGAFR